MINKLGRITVLAFTWQVDALTSTDAGYVFRRIPRTFIHALLRRSDICLVEGNEDSSLGSLRRMWIACQTITLEKVRVA
jgi:hypothetical protein